MKLSGFARKTWEFLKDNLPEVFEKKDPGILLGVSGGPDSIALLEVVREISFLWGEPHLEVAHVNYRLRESADRDERIVRAKCREAGIPLNILSFEKGNFEKEARLSGLSLEMYARRVRYDFFEKLKREKNFDFIFLAHTLSDLTETVLLHLVKGASISSLEGIPVKRDFYIRPILWAKREEVLSYLQEKGVDYGVDETNLNPDYTYRNFLRHRVLPLLKKINPSLEKTIFHLSLQSAEENRFWEEILEEHLRHLEDGFCVFLKGVPLKRLIFLFLKRYDMDVSFEKIKRIFLLTEAGVSGKVVETEKGNFFSCLSSVKSKPDSHMPDHFSSSGGIFFIFNEDFFEKEKGFLRVGAFALVDESKFSSSRASGLRFHFHGLEGFVKVSHVFLPREFDYSVVPLWRFLRGKSTFSEEFLKSLGRFVSGQNRYQTSKSLRIKKIFEKVPVNLRYAIPVLVERETLRPEVIFVPHGKFSFPESINFVPLKSNSAHGLDLEEAQSVGSKRLVLYLKRDFLNFHF